MAIFVGNLSNVTSVNADDYVYVYDGENIKKITVADFDTSITGSVNTDVTVQQNLIDFTDDDFNEGDLVHPILFAPQGQTETSVAQAYFNPDFSYDSVAGKLSVNSIETKNIEADSVNIEGTFVADITDCYFEYGGERMTFTELIENLLFKLSEGTGYIEVGNTKEWIEAGMPSYTSLTSTSGGSTSVGSGVTMETEDDMANTDSDDSTIGKLDMEDFDDSNDESDGDSANEETDDDSEDSDDSDEKDSIKLKEYVSEDE